MKKSKFKILYLAIFLCFIIFLYIAVNNVKDSSDVEKYNVLNDALSRGIVQCYAIEGFYPPNIEYLENNYGLVINHKEYSISYNIFASNIMPEFEIFRNQ